MSPLTMLYTPFAMYVGIVYSYLPFFILPLYANLEKMDWQLLEAARGPGMPPLAGVLQDHAAAVAQRDPGGLDAGVHSGGGRIRHSRRCSADRTH